MKKSDAGRILAVCCLCLMLAALSVSCMTRTTKEDGKTIDEETVWIWQNDF